MKVREEEHEDGDEEPGDEMEGIGRDLRFMILGLRFIKTLMAWINKD